MTETILKYNIDKWLNKLIGLLLLFLSIRLLINPSTIESFKLLNPSEPVRFALGISEAVVSILFLFNRTKLAGAIGLLLVFVFAAYIHLNVGKIPFALIPWTLSVLFVIYFDKKRKTDNM